MGTFTPPPPTQTELVAKRLVELCREGKHLDAIKELYADNARHIEAMEMPGGDCKRITEGKKALLEMGEKWSKTTTVHSASVGPALSNGDQFICEMKMDCTASEGPMAGQRMNMSEFAQYTVQNGKISEAKFFYGCGM